MDPTPDRKYWPNPDCPSRARIGRAAEYRRQVERCADCGHALVPGAAPEPPKPAERSGVSRELAGRLAFTVAFTAAAILSSRIRVPGIDGEMLSETLGFSNAPKLGLFAMGLMPFLSAFVIVE